MEEISNQQTFKLWMGIYGCFCLVYSENQEKKPEWKDLIKLLFGQKRNIKILGLGRCGC